MSQTTDYLESVPHATNGRSFSLHYTSIPAGSKELLYLHWHSEVELLYIEEGEGLFYIEDQEYHLSHGDALFIPPGLLHHGTSFHLNACSFHAIVFSPDYLFDTTLYPQYRDYVRTLQESPLSCCLHLTPSIPWQNHSLSQLSTLFPQATQPFSQWELFIHGTLLILWQQLYNHHFSRQLHSSHLQRFSQQIAPSLDYIHQHYPEDFSLKELSELSHFSEGQFCRLFKELTGFTPFHYVNRYRIMQSCHLLTNTSKKVAEIATFCGYNNISYFNREFRKRMGTSPRNYRKTRIWANGETYR